MGHPTMAKFLTIAIVLLTTSASWSERILQGKDSRDWRSVAREERSTDTADQAIRRVVEKIGNGTTTEKDDAELVRLIKEEIVATARRIKTPAGSIEAAAKRAQKLVSDLTASYTSAIYKSRTTEEARLNFARFQNTVQQIVDFIKNGQFVE